MTSQSPVSRGRDETEPKREALRRYWANADYSVSVHLPDWLSVLGHADIQSAFRRRYAPELLGSVRRTAQHRSEYKHRRSPECHQPRCIQSSSSNPSSLVLYFRASDWSSAVSYNKDHVYALALTHDPTTIVHRSKTCALGRTRAQPGSDTAAITARCMAGRYRRPVLPPALGVLLAGRPCQQHVASQRPLNGVPDADSVPPVRRACRSTGRYDTCGTHWAT